MNITFNNQDNFDRINYLTFTDVPNILKVSEYIDGTASTFEIDLLSNLQPTVTSEGQYSITFLGETITSTMNADNAKNKRFYISGDITSTAYSITQAFRNCSSIVAQFNVIHNGNSIHFLSKGLGFDFTEDVFFTNIPSAYLESSLYEGSVTSPLYNGKIFVDVYTDSLEDGNYITTLEKNFHSNEVAFDVSPVLATFSDYGKTTPYIFHMSAIYGNGNNKGDYSHLGNVSGFTTIGYHSNQSYPMLELSGTKILMHNIRDGKPITRYVYGDTIPYSVLVGVGVGRWSYSVSCKDSAFNEIWSSSGYDTYIGGSRIVDKSFTIPSVYFNASYYVDLTIGSDTVRFNVIKPLKASEGYQRVLWRNEYGGISFFDFTGVRSEDDNVEIETYEKNIFDYYEVSEFERKKIYKNDYEKTVTLTSHLFEKSGKWLFNSLMQSKKIWTYINGNIYYIIPTNIDVEEDQTYNGIYKATLQFVYSDI